MDGRIAANKARSKITDGQIIEAVKTMTRREIAEKYGVHVCNLDRRMHNLGVHALYKKPVRKQITSKKPNKTVKDWRWSESKAKMVLQRQCGRFELVEHKDGRIRIKCVECGSIIERANSTVRQKNVQCDCCEEKRKREQELEIGRKRVARILGAVAETKKPKTCLVCGKTFYTQYAEKKYCSERCKRKNRIRCRKRIKKYGAKYESGITLIHVFERDKGICQICGKPTDWNDNSWGDSFGAMYPTIDHITALANGGGHTWENVQLAHALCNSYKRDTA